MHLTKGGQGRSASLVAGSFEWIAACRAAFLVIENRRKNGEHMLLNLATNLGLKGYGLAFHIEDAVLSGEISAPKIVWKKKEVELSAEEALNARQPKHSATTNEAVEFLRETVVKPINVDDVFKLGKSAGFSLKELRTAREVLGLTTGRAGGLGSLGRWVWAPRAESAK
jgi:hypothetical protein